MHTTCKEVLQLANTALLDGDFEGFLRFCTDDTVWNFVGDRTLEGKAAVRDYMHATYGGPPEFEIHQMIEEGDVLTAVGEITLQDETGAAIRYAACDIWRFRDGKMAELRAFVIPISR